jgi:hypothetical protein
MKRTALIVLAVVLAFSPVIAQQPGTITGVVRDGSGAPLPGVTVVAAGPQSAEGRRPVVTDAQGRFTIEGLPLGSYSLSFGLPGFAPLTITDVAATGITPTPIEAVMRVGALGDTQTFRSAPFPGLPGQPRQDARIECLHGVNETPAERERREEAFNAMRMIYSVLRLVPANGRGFPDWLTLSGSNAVAVLKKRPGPAGELANKIQWGSPEPLPGWRLTYSGGISVLYTLRDLTDVCGYTLSSNDPQVIPPFARTMPLS